uniref:Uncharacterized protein n=1 Tax=Rhizophora mucronata TaxID=61149 RepID=A0A2P2P8K5_RHIMU
MITLLKFDTESFSFFWISSWNLVITFLKFHIENVLGIW